MLNSFFFLRTYLTENTASPTVWLTHTKRKIHPPVLFIGSYLPIKDILCGSMSSTGGAGMGACITPGLLLLSGVISLCDCWGSKLWCCMPRCFTSGDSPISWLILQKANKCQTTKILHVTKCRTSFLTWIVTCSVPPTRTAITSIT